MSSVSERFILTLPENCLSCVHDYYICSLAKEAATFWDTQNRLLSPPIYCPLHKIVEKNLRDINSWAKEYLCQFTSPAIPTVKSTGQNSI